MRRSRTCTDVGVRTGWLLAAVVLLAACDPLRDYGGLDEQLQAYYRAEQTGDWSQVYDLRVRDFRWSVSRDYFVTAMREDARGWELLGYDVLGAEPQGEKVRIHLHFRYRYSGDHPEWRMVTAGDGRMEIEDTSLWSYEDGRWLCEDAGIRQHLPMSDPLN